VDALIVDDWAMAPLTIPNAEPSGNLRRALLTRDVTDESVAGGQWHAQIGDPTVATVSWRQFAECSWALAPVPYGIFRQRQKHREPKAQLPSIKTRKQANS